MHDELRATFDDALASAIAGKSVPDSINLDDETVAALARVNAAAPHPAAGLIQAAREEFDELLADLQSVHQREHNTIPAAQLRDELGIEDWLDNLDVHPADARDGSHMRRIAAATNALDKAVADARDAGDSWAMIGTALGVSADEARRRFDR
jgi:hypothetical protein